MSFVERHRLWSDEQKEAASRLRPIVEKQKLEVVRLSFPDQHGILRGKTLVANEALASLESGCSITTTMLAKDTSHRTVFPVFTSGGGFGMREMEGAADFLMVPDPTDVSACCPGRRPPAGCCATSIFPTGGRCRSRRAISTGRFSISSPGAATISSPGWKSNFTSSSSKMQKCRRSMRDNRANRRDVSLLSHGYQYLTEQRYDQMEPVLEIIRRDVAGARPAPALDRSRVRPEPVRIHLPAGARP